MHRREIFAFGYVGFLGLPDFKFDIRLVVWLHIRRQSVPWGVHLVFVFCICVILNIQFVKWGLHLIISFESVSHLFLKWCQLRQILVFTVWYRIWIFLACPLHFLHGLRVHLRLVPWFSTLISDKKWCLNLVQIIENKFLRSVDIPIYLYFWRHSWHLAQLNIVIELFGQFCLPPFFVILYV